MGRTLEEFIASLPKDQQDRIEARYEALRRDYLESSDTASADQAQVKENQDAQRIS